MSNKQRTIFVYIVSAVIITILLGSMLRPQITDKMLQNYTSSNKPKVQQKLSVNIEKLKELTDRIEVEFDNSYSSECRRKSSSNTFLLTFECLGTYQKAGKINFNRFDEKAHSISKELEGFEHWNLVKTDYSKYDREKGFSGSTRYDLDKWHDDILCRIYIEASHDTLRGVVDVTCQK